MDYISCRFNFENPIPWREILMVRLSELPFESFEEKEKELLAYIPHNQFNEIEVNKILLDLNVVGIVFTHELIKDQNWNKTWEESFTIIEINKDCIVRAPFHQPERSYLYDLIINPQMSFGTGHHQTTSLLLNKMTGDNFNGLSVLDMGCGTGVLAILASKKGAKKIKAIDIDHWSVLNTKENIVLNNIENIEVFEGGAELLHENEKFDVILANINRNILLQDFDQYFKSLKTNGKIWMSGFFLTDVPFLEEKAHNLGLIKTYEEERENWAMVEFTKK